MYKNTSSNDILEALRESDFPHVQLVQASAGSGKTYLLTKKIVQFLLSKDIKNNKINNIVAITFTKNSANDIKNKTLEWFKKIHLDMLDNKQKMQIINITGLDDNELIEQSSFCIDEILDNYNDLFLTIDSFLTKILYASAIELELNPDFEVDVNLDSIIEYAFSEFLENMTTTHLREVLNLLNEASRTINFHIVDSIKSDLSYLLDQESSHKSEFNYDEMILGNLKIELEDTIDAMIDLLERFRGCDIKNNTKNETIERLKTSLKERNFLDIVSNKLNFPYKDNDAKEHWDKCYEKISQNLYQISTLKHLPYIKLFKEFKKYIIKTYNTLGKTYLQDANKKLIKMLNEGFVPTIYYTIGSYIYHYLIDEFQDTSYIQWEILKPLIDESLSKGGSLFVVGDLKQAIYGFRKADFEVMNHLIENANTIFPQSKHIEKKYIYTNYRSFEHIVNYSKMIFKQSLKDTLEEINDPIGYLSFEQNSIDEHLNKGFVKTQVFSYENGEGIDCIKGNLLQTIQDLINSGFKQEQIAILARTNEEINTISGWLLENNYTVLSQSASDIRQRKMINELFAFLKFLNNPSDNLSFATFILGDIFNCLVERKKIMDFLLENVGAQMLYRRFKEQFATLWELYFKDIFNTLNYVPLYELLLNIIRTFKIDQNFEQESHYLSFLLDRVIELEQIGISDASSFIDYLEKAKPNQTKIFSCEFSNTQNGIQLLTIHKAKGLQFDVVINVLDANKNYALNPKKVQKPKNQFVFENEVNNRLDLLYITKKLKQDDNLLSDIYDKALLKDNIEDLNVLYVALTRAKMQMYNFIYYNKTKDIKCRLEDTQIGSQQDLLTKQPSLSINKQQFVTFSVNYNKIINQSSSWTIKRLKDSKRGAIYHEILSHLRYEEDFNNIDFLIEKYAKFIDDVYTMEQKILSILKHKELKKLFSHDNIVFTEKTFIDKNGNIFRMDRVVIDPNQNIYVIDYKTGEFSQREIEDYKLQVSNYMQVLKDIYQDKNVFGMLYNIDQGVVSIV